MGQETVGPVRSSRQARRQLRELAELQGGYFTAKQARALGYGAAHVAYHVAQGNFEGIYRGLFRLVEVPIAEQDQLIRLSLLSRNRADEPQAVVSHESALVLHNLSEVLPEQVHLIVPPRFRKSFLEGCVLHTRSLKPEEMEGRTGFRVTTPLRTLVDVASSTTSFEQLTRAVYDALHLGLVSARELNAVADSEIRLREALEMGRFSEPRGETRRK